MVNKLLIDLPFCTFFAHIGCYLKDLIVKIDDTHNPSAPSMAFPATGTIAFSRPQDQVSGRKSMNPLGGFGFGGSGKDSSSHQPS